jgi:hypothetical protein
MLDFSHMTEADKKECYLPDLHKKNRDQFDPGAHGSTPRRRVHCQKKGMGRSIERFTMATA